MPDVFCIHLDAGDLIVIEVEFVVHVIELHALEVHLVAKTTCKPVNSELVDVIKCK